MSPTESVGELIPLKDTWIRGIALMSMRESSLLDMTVDYSAG